MQIDDTGFDQYNRGRRDRAAGKPCFYGCHVGMRSTLEQDKNDYFRGWHDEDYMQRRPLTYDRAKLRIWNPETYTPAEVRAAAVFVLASIDAPDEDVRQAEAVA